MQRLKLEVLKFLGELGGQDNQYVVRTDRRDISTLAVSWSTKEHIKFVMPFKDTKTDIYLGTWTFFPRMLVQNCPAYSLSKPLSNEHKCEVKVCLYIDLYKLLFALGHHLY